MFIAFVFQRPKVPDTVIRLNHCLGVTTVAGAEALPKAYRNAKFSFSFRIIVSKSQVLKQHLTKNYNPANLIIVPIRIPNMDVEADNIPRRIYPVINPIFRGI